MSNKIKITKKKELEKLREAAETEIAIKEAKEYLQSTDYLVIKHIELGTEIPPEISEKRAEARNFISSNSLED